MERSAPTASPWTRERPDEPGEYWVRSSGGRLAVVHVFESEVHADLRALLPGRGRAVPLKDKEFAGAEWSARLEPPDHAETGGES